MLVHWRHHLHIVSRCPRLSAWKISEPAHPFVSPPLCQLLKQHPSPGHVCIHMGTHTHTCTHTRAHTSTCPDLHQVIKTELDVNPLSSHMVVCPPSPPRHLLTARAAFPAVEQAVKRGEAKARKPGGHNVHISDFPPGDVISRPNNGLEEPGPHSSPHLLGLAFPNLLITPPLPSLLLCGKLCS